MNTWKASAVSALLGALLFGCEDRNPTAASDGATGADALTGVSATGADALTGASATAAGSVRMRWDIISVDFATGTASAGGVASARANDSSKITLTGSGTFNPTAGKLQHVTGGGTWKTFAPDRSVTGSGSYQVTGFVSFTKTPGTFPLQHDNIGTPFKARAGFLVVNISYSDGSDGVLIVSCHFVGTPDAVFEGVTATKGFVDYWRRAAPPAPPGNANRTNFHILP
jgi:hypothetical protein